MTCKDCISYDICAYNAYVQAEYSGRAVETYITIDNKLPCRFFKDKSRYIELPCKAGDTVYIPNIFLKKVYKYRVDEINIGAGNNNVVVLDQYFSDFILPRNCAIYFNQFGKTVFLSREEAEKALAERSNNENN